MVQFKTIQFSKSTQFKCEYSLIVKTFLFRAIQLRQVLRGVENKRDIFFMYITRCVSFTRIIPRRRIKLEKEAPNEPFLITHDSRLKEEEKKKRRRQEMELQVNPFPLITHLSYPWTLGMNFGWLYQPRVRP